MNRPSSIIWLAFILILLIPSTAGRFLLDIAGGLILIIFLVPILLGGLGWFGWKILQARSKTCDNCGASFFNEVPQCPVCGKIVSNSINKENKSNKTNNSIPASSVIIDVDSEDIK
mgnify:CR=1 FL=1|tara:strand:+ start:353 stop:700 length:348 start_codon:yes stop_codon:yes gene_type:complete